ncbi:Transcriptional regulator, IclR family [Halomonas citrativorans]|uniref:Transcriptional regulator, IclR family n=1 Tax=Halomonas citrativorans TaxID=2742612 RepID=A0A1R4I3L4_9GAMM|nr:IclR family transcriptional regulator [Halomonas citrativorans]SJN13943.1 Transcriptional regulator, IclR family [Halomonas citrativorans]
MKEKAETQYHAPALEKGLDILELLAQSSQPLSTQAIAEQIGRKTNEMYRMLMVLRDRGYVSMDDSGSRYQLTLKIFEMAHRFPPTKRLVQAALPRMEELCHEISQSCHLSVARPGHLLVVAQYENPDKMGFGLRLGAKIDICGSGSGAVMLAFLDEPRRARVLAASDATVEEVVRTRALFDPIRQQGYHIGPSPQVQGLTNISFPVFGVHEVIEAVITIPYLTLIPEAMHREVPSIDRCREQLGELANALTMAIGGRLPKDTTS